MIGRAAADGDAHRGGIALVDIRGEHLPGGIKGIGDGDILKGGQPRESARRHHLVDIVGGRLVGRGVEIVGLRIGAVAVADDFLRAQERILIDDIHGELRAGKSARCLEVIDGHIAGRIPRLPFGIQSVIGGRSARRVPPDDAVADIAELARGIDHARTGDVRLNEHAVMILFPGVDLLGEHRIDRAAHLRIVVGLRTEAGVHVADILQRAVHIGRGAVRRKLIRNGDEPLIHRIGRRLVEKERVDRERAAHQDGAGGDACKPLDEAAVMLRLETKPILLSYRLGNVASL